MSYDLPPDIERIVQDVQRAPSIFNTRPWWFQFRPPDHIELWLSANLGERDGAARARARDGAARARARDNVARARAREYVISCGAALFNLRLAIRMAGHDLVVWQLPDPAYADPMHPPALLASVEIVTGRVKKPVPGSKDFMRRSGDVTRAASRTGFSRRRFPSSRPWKTLLPRKAPTFGSSTAARPGRGCAWPPKLTAIRHSARHSGITFLRQITGRLRRTATREPGRTSGPAAKSGVSSASRN